MTDKKPMPDEIWIEPKPACWGSMLFSGVNPNNDSAVKYIRSDLCAKDGGHITRADIKEIMQDCWNDWVADTGCFPSDFEIQRGKKLEFNAGSWAGHIADCILHRLKKTPTPTEAKRDVVKDIETIIEYTGGDIHGFNRVLNAAAMCGYTLVRNGQALTTPDHTELLREALQILLHEEYLDEAWLSCTASEDLPVTESCINEMRINLIAKLTAALKPREG